MSVKRVYVRDLKPGDKFIWGDESTRDYMCLDGEDEDVLEDCNGQRLIVDKIVGNTMGDKIYFHSELSTLEKDYFEDSLYFESHHTALRCDYASEFHNHRSVLDQYGDEKYPCDVCGHPSGQHRSTGSNCPKVDSDGRHRTYHVGGYWNSEWAATVRFEKADSSFFASLGL